MESHTQTHTDTHTCPRTHACFYTQKTKSANFLSLCLNCRWSWFKPDSFLNLIFGAWLYTLVLASLQTRCGCVQTGFTLLHHWTGCDTGAWNCPLTLKSTNEAPPPPLSRDFWLLLLLSAAIRYSSAPPVAPLGALRLESRRVTLQTNKTYWRGGSCSHWTESICTYAIWNYFLVAVLCICEKKKKKVFPWRIWKTTFWLCCNLSAIFERVFFF